MIKEKIQEKASAILNSVTTMRHHLHQHPELSFKEFQTAEFISQQLTKSGIEHHKGIAGTGITAVIAGRGQHHKRVALRADIDALPILETGNPPYKSVNDGVMHACGHDVHTSALLGAAQVLHELRDHWDGSVQLVFQPAEEVLPGGASLMIKEGIFESHKPTAMFGQHVFPELPVGTVGFRPGIYMASCDELYLVVKGRGGHGAKPDKAIDPVLITAHLIVAMQQVVSRWCNPQMPSVLSFGKVIANGATNIIPNEVVIHGTFRTFDETWRKEAHQRIIQMARSLVTGMGGEIDIRLEIGYPVLRNEPELTARARKVAEEYLGSSNVADLEMRTTAEDFAYYSHIMPSCFYRLGTASADGRNSFPVHHSSFDIDEEALKTGVGLIAYEAVRELGNS